MLPSYSVRLHRLNQFVTTGAGAEQRALSAFHRVMNPETHFFFSFSRSRFCHRRHRNCRVAVQRVRCCAVPRRPSSSMLTRACSYFSIEETRSIIAEGFAEYRQVCCFVSHFLLFCVLQPFGHWHFKIVPLTSVLRICGILLTLSSSWAFG